MLPVLHVFGGAVQTYYVCAALAALAGFLLAWLRLRRILPGVQAWLVPLAMLLLGLIGARGLNVLTNPEAYAHFSPWTIQYTKLSLMGGLGLGAAGLLLYCAASRRAPGPVLDAFVLPSAVGIVLLKIGCFCNGCCFGKPTEGPFGVIFPANAVKYAFLESLPLVKPSSRVVHPTQLYEIAGALAALGLSELLGRLFRLRPGGRAAVFAGGFCLARLAVLPLRVLPYPEPVKRIFYPALYLAVAAVCTIFAILSARRGQAKSSAGEETNG